MSSVVTYANNERQCFCQSKFDSGERVLISIAAVPTPSIKVMRLALGGLIPRQIIWEYNATMAGGPDAYVRDLMEMFPPDPNSHVHPLDIIRDTLLRCSSIEDARRRYGGTRRESRDRALQARYAAGAACAAASKRQRLAWWRRNGRGDSVMTGWIGWVLFGLLLLWYFASQRFAHRKRLHLRNYVVYLLLDDTIRNDHKAKFEQWIRESDASNALELSSMAHSVIENMADSLASKGSSTLAAHAMLWNSDAASELRRRQSS